MLILAIDTSSATASVAVHDGSSVVASAVAEQPMAHAESLAPLITSALSQCGAQLPDVTDIAAGVGPGPFTGLRVGVMTALTLAQTQTPNRTSRADGCGPRTHGVCSLDALAAEVTRDIAPTGEFLIATDARRKEVYWGRYDAASRRLEGPGVARPEELAAAYPNLPAYGRGAEMYSGVLDAVPGPTDPAAQVLAAGVASGAFSEHDLQPLYLRRPDAKPLPGR